MRFSPKTSLLGVAFLLLLAGGGIARAESAPALPEPEKIKTALSSSASLFPDFTIERGELVRLYEARDFKPAWNTDPAQDRAPLNAFLETVTAFTAYHGLSEKDYPTGLLREMIASKKTEDAVRLELLMTSWLLQLAHDMQGDRINLAQIYPGWSLSRGKRDIAGELGAAIAQGTVQSFFEGLAPKSLDYLRLAEALKTYREMEKNLGGAWPTVAAGPSLKPGMRDPRVAQLRARLAAEGYVLVPPSQGDEDLYTESLKETVIAYQARGGLEADGAIGGKTFAALNVPLAKRIGQILANMERMRHIPDVFPPRYVRVNSADASIKVIDEGREVYNAVVVLGRPDRKTPFIHSAIRSVIFNPSWTVPSKIAREDILPKLRKDPHYLEKMGMVINGSADDPYGTAIDWNAVTKSEFNFRLRQSPGDLNSLGQLKFDFDNDFSVYLHDTSHPDLFAKAERHLSSGCVRLKDPELFARLVLEHNEGDWTQEKVQAEIDKGKTRWLKVATPLPLYILYDTAFFPTPESQINFRADIYNYDSFLLNMMREERGRK